jgi:hypothetical protein
MTIIWVIRDKQGGNMVLYGPGSVQIGNQGLNPELCDILLRALLGIREQPRGIFKRSWHENKSARN